MLSTPTQHDITKDHVWEFQHNVTMSGPVPSIVELAMKWSPAG